MLYKINPLNWGIVAGKFRAYGVNGVWVLRRVWGGSAWEAYKEHPGDTLGDHDDLRQHEFESQVEAIAYANKQHTKDLMEFLDEATDES